MLDRKNRLITEIINNGKLSEYEEIIKEVIENISQQGFIISTRYDSSQSAIDWISKRIRISLIKDPMSIVWDLFHEYGHLISGEKCGGSKLIDCDREVKAWDNAFTKLSKYPRLLSQKDNFDKYRVDCLKTYCANHHF